MNEPKKEITIPGHSGYTLHDDGTCICEAYPVCPECRGEGTQTGRGNCPACNGSGRGKWPSTTLAMKGDLG